MIKNKKMIKIISVVCCMLIITCSMKSHSHAGIIADGTGTSGSSGIITDNYGGFAGGAISTALHNTGSSWGSFFGAGGCGLLYGASLYDTINAGMEIFTTNGDGSASSRADRCLLVTDFALSVYALGAGLVFAAGATTLGGAFIAAAGATGAAFLLSKIAIAMARQMIKDINLILDSLPDPNNSEISVYKPNIYLYSKNDLKANVKISPYEYITCSIPEYDRETGWNAEIYNGSLNGSNDYLFYEAIVPDKGFQKESGFFIKGCHMEADMKKILDKYDFNETEKYDFIEYWNAKLSHDTDYVFYPQNTNVVDSIIPARINPEPDNIFRMWFYIEEFYGQSFSVPVECRKIKRWGFSVVEWGGIVAE